MSSLQQQLRRQWLISLLIIMLPLLWLADYGVRQMTSHYVVSRLQHDADSLTAALTQDEQGRWQVDSSRLGSFYQRVYSGHYFAIRDTLGTDLRSRSLWDRNPPPADFSTAQDSISNAPGIQGDQHDEQWLSLSRRIQIGDHRFHLWIAEDIAPLQAELNRYRLIALLLLGLALLSLLLVQRRLLNKAFARLQPLQQQLRELRFGERNDLNSAHADYPQEVQPLAEEVDRLLKLLQERVSRSRNALGNLAHEMKRPLQQLQLLAEQLSPEQQQQQRDILQRLQTLTQRELKRARIVGLSSPGRQTRLAAELPALIRVLNQLYPQVTFHCHYQTDAVLPQDRDDMLELLGNLLDNACKYAGGDIELSIELNSGPQPQHWLIRICDQGPGIAAGECERLLKRGTRLDEQGGQNNDGSGLGLAIVSDIVASYGGTLQLHPHQPHGLCVTVQLPAGLSSPA